MSDVSKSALGVDIGIGVMGDGAGEVADADALVEGDGAEPHRPLLIAAVEHFPEADVMTAIRALAGGLLESEILAAAEIEQRADRRVPVGAVEQHAAGDLDRGFQGDGIGGKPARRVHRAKHFLLVADQPDIDGVAGNALRGARHHRQVGEALLVLVVRPQRRQQQIGDGGVDRDDRKQRQQHALEAGVMMGAELRFVVVGGHGIAYSVCSLSPRAGRGLG